MGLGLGLCQPSSYLCLRCLAAASTQGPVSTVRAWDVALLSIMSIIRGPIFISAVSLPVAIFASAKGSIFCLRGPVLWPVSSPHRPPSSSSFTPRRRRAAPLSSHPRALPVTSRTWRVISSGAVRLQIWFRQNFRNFPAKLSALNFHFRVQVRYEYRNATRRQDVKRTSPTGKSTSSDRSSLVRRPSAHERRGYRPRPRRRHG